MKEIRELLEITERLKRQYGRSFTLDGKLVGDIGEVLAAKKYGLTLLDQNNEVHDAVEKSTNRKIQIKSSFGNISYFPCAHVPDYYLAIRILEDGSIEELFNGTGEYIKTMYIDERRLKANGRYLYNLSGDVLKGLNRTVSPEHKIGNI